MFRTTDIVLFAAMVAAAAFTYQTKHEAERELAGIKKIEAQIRVEEDTIDVLKADWSLLTQPARLQKLTETFQSQLKLQPTDAHQFVSVDQLPARPVGIDANPDKQTGAAADNQPDRKIKTGGIVR